MEAEISLLMANQTQVCESPIGVVMDQQLTLWQAAPGKLMYDPFIGTGSMAYVRT